jgi:ribosomal protein S18 acetylase RimI-like enzyme
MSQVSMSPQSTQRSSLRVVVSQPEDRRAIYDVLMNSGLFGREDADCVDQMFADALVKGLNAEDGYRFLSCWMGEGHESLAGFACFGREALTHGTWDLFWICTSSAARRMGVARALLNEVERLAREEQARLMVIYTSSTDRFAPARGLYESQGFTRAATVPDYYAEGDHLFIYCKRYR